MVASDAAALLVASVVDIHRDIWMVAEEIGISGKQSLPSSKKYRFPGDHLDIRSI